MKNRLWYRLGVKTIVFIVCVIAVDFIIGKFFDVLGDRIYDKDPKATPSDYMVKNMESDVVVLGASIASRHYIPSMIEDSLLLSAYNCGFDGTPFVVQNSLLNLMLDRYKPKVIVWEIGEVSMETEKDIKHIAYLYPYYDKNKQARAIVDGTDRFQRFRMLSKTYRHNSEVLNELKTLLGPAPRESQLSLKGYMPLDTTGYIFPTKIHKKFANTLDTNKVVLLESTIIRCKESNVPIVFSSSPRYIENYDEIKASHSYRALIDVANKYDVPFLDFYELYSNDSTLFKDNAHMNDKGARKYMGVFIPALKHLCNY